MGADYTFRRANEGDKDFIIDTIVGAEKGEYEFISYCSIFSITEAQFRELLSNILDEHVEGQEICLSNFLIAEMDGKIAGTLAAFIENKNGLSSNMLKTSMLMYFLGKEAMYKATPLMNILNEVNMSREPNTLQFEYGMMVEEHRGKGLLRKLMDEHVRVIKEAGTDLKKVQLVILKNNISSLKSHEKAGFITIQERTATNPDILKLIACDTKILMEKKL